MSKFSGKFTIEDDNEDERHKKYNFRKNLPIYKARTRIQSMARLGTAKDVLRGTLVKSEDQDSPYDGMTGEHVCEHAKVVAN
jgi:hypothetical protein